MDLILRKEKGGKKANRAVHCLPQQTMLEFSYGERVNMEKSLSEWARTKFIEILVILPLKIKLSYECTSASLN